MHEVKRIRIHAIIKDTVAKKLGENSLKNICILQEPDIKHLTETIWGCQSALSGSADLYELVFVRWEKRIEWSPWNCILLTKEEVSAHSSLEDVNEVCRQF